MDSSKKLINYSNYINFGRGRFRTSWGTNPNEEAKIIKYSLVPLSTGEVGNRFEDLKGLKDILQDKQIIGIGRETSL